jgi:hypothetical protein
MCDVINKTTNHYRNTSVYFNVTILCNNITKTVMFLQRKYVKRWPQPRLVTGDHQWFVLCNSVYLYKNMNFDIECMQSEFGLECFLKKIVTSSRDTMVGHCDLITWQQRPVQLLKILRPK